MNERFIYLTENYLDENLTPEEKNELFEILDNNAKLKKEFEEQKRIKEALSVMMLQNPSREAWDGYWTELYNKLERGFAWILISIGAIIVLAFAAIQFVEKLLETDKLPLLEKAGIFLLIIGFAVLVVSLLREKLFKNKHDKFKEVQR
jgi:hypothetical protein